MVVAECLDKSHALVKLQPETPGADSEPALGEEGGARSFSGLEKQAVDIPLGADCASNPTESSISLEMNHLAKPLCPS